MGWLLHDKTHVWAPAWEAWLTLAGLVFFAWPCPSLCHSWHLPASPPSDPVHALVSWHVAGLFALASRPCERHILTTLREGSSQRGSDGRGVGGGGGVCVEVETMNWGGWGGGTMGSWKSSVLCMFVIMCSWYIWMCDIAAWSKGNMPHCNCFWGMACTGRSLRVYRPPRRPLRVPEEKGAGVSWQCVEISVVPADVIQQMLTQTFLSVHIRSPAKVHPLCAERVYKYRLGQRDRTDTNLQNGVHANFKGFSHTHCGAWADSAHMPMTREGVKLIENNLIALQNQKLQTLKVKSYIKNSHSATGHRTLHWTRTS